MQFNGGRTATHEIGHWLNLIHIWGDRFCGTDEVADTPQQERATTGCPGFIAGCQPGERAMTMNYMDYTDDACMNAFSFGQRTRMRAVFESAGARRFAQYGSYGISGNQNVAELVQQGSALSLAWPNRTYTLQGTIPGNAQVTWRVGAGLQILSQTNSSITIRASNREVGSSFVEVEINNGGSCGNVNVSPIRANIRVNPFTLSQSSTTLDACYRIKHQRNGNYVQAMSDGQVFQQTANGQTNQLWKVQDAGDGMRKLVSQNGTNQVVAASGSGSFGNALQMVNYTGSDMQRWLITDAIGETIKRVSLANAYTWDVRDAGGSQVVQLWGTLSEDVVDFRSFNFESATCPTTPNCNFAVSPSVSDGNTNRSCSQAVTLNANCLGNDCSGISYSWSGTGVPANSTNSSVTFNGPGSNGNNYAYTVTTSKAGCSNQTATVNFNVSGCSTGGGGTTTCIEAETGSGNMGIQSNPAASGGQFYGNFGDNTGYVNYPVNVATAGTYTLAITYGGGNATALNVVINNGAPQQVNLPFSGGWYTFATQNTTVSLPAGNSTLSFRGIANQFVIFDKFCLTGGSGGGGGSCNFALTSSIADGNTNRSCNQGVTLNSSCAGSDCGAVSYSWSGNSVPANSTNASVTFNGPGSNGNNYAYTVTTSKAGCSSQTATVNFNVSGCSTGGGGTTTCIEAETGQGNMSVQNNSAASGGQFYGNFGDDTRYVDYPINVPTAGNYTLAITYGGGEATSFNVVVNNGSPQLVSLPYSGGWYTFATQNATVSLPAGNNTLSFRGRANQYVIFDKFCLTGGSGGGSCNFALSPSISDGNTNRSCSQAITLNANCSGSDCGGVNYNWSGNGASGSNSSASFNVPGANGSYQYTVTALKAGCGNQTGTVTINVSGCGGGGTTSCIEAETGQGNGTVQFNSAASGGSFYGNFGGNDSYVNYPVSVASAGTYTIQFTYAYPAGPVSFRASVNNGSTQTVNFPASPGWYDFSTRSFTVSLPAGSNTLNILGLDNYFFYFDKFCVQSGARLAAQEPSETELDLRVAPNPSNGRFTVHFRTQIGKTATLRLSDLNGRAVRTTQTIMGTGGTHDEAIVLPASVHGVLLIDVVSGSQRASQKVLVE